MAWRLWGRRSSSKNDDRIVADNRPRRHPRNRNRKQQKSRTRTTRNKESRKFTCGIAFQNAGFVLEFISQSPDNSAVMVALKHASCKRARGYEWSIPRTDPFTNCMAGGPLSARFTKGIARPARPSTDSVSMITSITAIRVIALGLMCLLVGNCYADFLVDGKINGRPARLSFDTESDNFFLWDESARKLGLKFDNSAISGSVAPGDDSAKITQVCKLSLLGNKGKTRFIVLDLPQYVHRAYDGIIGGQHSATIFLSIDAENEKVKGLSTTPKNLQMDSFPLQTNSDVLGLELREANGTAGIIWIDTGAEETGVALAPKRWRNWKAQHGQQPTTFLYGFSPQIGVATVEAAWADQIALGPLVLSNVPVMEMLPTNPHLNHQIP